MLKIYYSFKPIPKKVLHSLNRYLHISFQPQSKINAWIKHKLHHSKLLNPSLAIKSSFKYLNHKLYAYNHTKNKPRYWWVSILGLTLGFLTHYTD